MIITIIIFDVFYELTSLNIRVTSRIIIHLTLKIKTLENTKKIKNEVL